MLVMCSMFIRAALLTPRPLNPFAGARPPCPAHLLTPTDPTYRPSNPELLAKSYSRGAAFRFALPQPQYLNFSGPGGEEARQGEWAGRPGL